MDSNSAIQVDNVTIRFNRASQKVDNLKEHFIKMIRRELMFQEFLALKNITFEVKAGEAWGILGRNGSGKSTLLKAICGILSPYKGTVKVQGSMAPLIELGAGFDGDLTAEENIYLNGALLGYSKAYMQEKYDEIVDFAELQNFLDMPLKNYSSGMRARLGFSVATTVRPQILIVDEVLSVGDAAFQKKCEARIQEMLNGGTTLLFVSHSIDQVRRLCQKALLLREGLQIAMGSVEEVARIYQESL
jgi:lipopolysaccharide transport system ATP-binding protein